MRGTFTGWEINWETNTAISYLSFNHEVARDIKGIPIALQYYAALDEKKCQKCHVTHLITSIEWNKWMEW